MRNAHELGTIAENMFLKMVRTLNLMLLELEVKCLESKCLNRLEPPPKKENKIKITYMIKALTELTFVIREWKMSKDCGAAFSFTYEHKRAELATAVAPVSSALCPGQDGLAGHPLAVRRQAQVAHEVDETRGQVQLAAKLTGCIVVRKRMVVVVESFA